MELVPNTASEVQDKPFATCEHSFRVPSFSLHFYGKSKEILNIALS